MVAVLGGDPAEVLPAIEAAGLTVANRNGAGQIVAAGAVEGVEALVAAPPTGSTSRRLEVVAPSTPPSWSPRAPSRGGRAGRPLHRSRASAAGNADGALVATGAECAARLVAQLTAPVRWDLCQAAVLAAAPAQIVELPPAGVLAGLLRRAGGPRAVAVARPGELARAATRTAVPA